MSVEFNDDVVLTSICLAKWDYDDDYNKIPYGYEVELLFFGYSYTLIFSICDIEEFINGNDLENSGCAGDSILFKSASDYFEDFPESAEKLISEIKDFWEEEKEEENPYNYLGELC